MRVPGTTRLAWLVAATTLAAWLGPPAKVQADPDDDLPRIMRTRELKREGSFRQALDEATLLYEESAARDQSPIEMRNRRIQMETLRAILAMSPGAQAEIAQAEQDWWAAWSLYGEGKYDEAEVPSRRSLEVRERHFGRHHFDVAASVEQLGLFRSLQNNYDDAERLLSEALATYDEIAGESSAASGTAHNNLATMFSAQAKYAEAEEHFRIHLRLFQEYHPENHEEIAAALSNLAVTLGHRGDPASGEHLLSEALRIRRSIHPPDHPSISLSLNLMGSNCWARGDVDNAEAMYREALFRREETLGPDHPSVAVSLTNLAVVVTSLGRYEGALAMHERALEIRRERFGERHRKTARSLQNLGDVHWKLDRPGLAEQHFLRSRAITVDIHGEQHPGVASIDRSLARLAASRGELDEAEQLFRQSLKTDRSILGNAHQVVTDGLVHLGRLAMRRERWTTAATYFQEASGVHEAVRARFDSPMDRASFQSSPDLLLATALLELGREEEVWPHVERAHGRLLVDLLQTGPRPETANAHRPRAADYGRPASLSAVQATLTGTSAMIGWVDISIRDGASHSWAWIVRHEGPVRWVRLEPAPATASEGDVAERLRDGLVLAGSWPFRVAPDPRLRRDAQQLGRERLGPVLPALDDVETLLVVPSGPIHGIPVESLLDEDGVPFGARWAISYTPSPTIHAWLVGAPSVPSAQRTALLVGDPHHGDGFAPLPGAREEVARVGSFFSGAHILLGEDANERALVELARSGALAKFDAIHLATHAIADPDRPDRSALVLAAEHSDGLRAALAGERIYDGFVTVDEIGREWQLNADLVTLSGCGTALGKKVAGQGFLGFAHAFFQAGARSLVLSLWKVDDQAASLLMTRFYGNLTQRGLRKADALREARQWLRTWQDGAGNTPFEHPAYWSAFVLMGDPGEAPPPQAPRP